MRLNVRKDRLGIIPEFERYCGIYKCIRCDKLWDENRRYYYHNETTVCDLFPGDIHKHPPTIIEKSRRNRISVSNKTNEFSFILLLMLSRLIFLKRTYLEINRN